MVAEVAGQVDAAEWGQYRGQRRVGQGDGSLISAGRPHWVDAATG